MSAFSKQKQQLRESAKGRLESLSFFELIEKTDRLRDHFFRTVVHSSLSHFSGKYLVSFYPFETEPQINIEDEPMNEPYQVAYVRVDDWKNRLMSASAARRDQPGQWEDIEPVAGVRIFQPNLGQPRCLPDSIAAILVPGLAFSAHGERLGRGAGFYDRFLAQNPHALRIGIGFSEQILPQIPHEPFDQVLDIVLTDQSVFETNRFSAWKKHGKVLER